MKVFQRAYGDTGRRRKMVNSLNQILAVAEVMTIAHILWRSVDQNMRRQMPQRPGIGMIFEIPVALMTVTVLLSEYYTLSKFHSRKITLQ